MTYYSIDRVKEIIRNYYRYKQIIKEYRKDYSSVGVTVYSEEAAMPRANNISDVTANEAMRQVEEVKVYANMRTDIKYVDDRLYRIDKERDAQIVNMFMQGYNTYDISTYYNCTKRNIDKRLDIIAHSICSVT